MEGIAKKRILTPKKEPCLEPQDPDRLFLYFFVGSTPPMPLGPAPPKLLGPISPRSFSSLSIMKVFLMLIKHLIISQYSDFNIYIIMFTLISSNDVFFLKIKEKVEMK
jgi:hypothetical protein